MSRIWTMVKVWKRVKISDSNLLLEMYTIHIKGIE